jgi:hypothetical protein
MEIVVLYVLALVNGDVYSKTITMPTPSKRECVAAGAAWMDHQDPKDSPQYLCLVKSNVATDTKGGPAQ